MADKSAEIQKNFEYSLKTNPFLADLDMREVNSYTNPQENALAELMMKMGLKPENYLYSGFYGRGLIDKILQNGHVFDRKDFKGEVYCFELTKTDADGYEFVNDEESRSPFQYAMGMQNEGQVDEAIAVYDKKKVDFGNAAPYAASFRGDPRKALRGVFRLVNWEP